MHPYEYEKVRAGALPVAGKAPAGTVATISPGAAPQSPRTPPALDDDALLTSGQTRARVGGVSAMCIWRWMRDPRVMFPTPVKIGGKSRNYWRLGDLRRWQAERVTKTA